VDELLFRGDLGLERVQAYSDALLSIIATINVVPFIKMQESFKKEILVEGTTLAKVLLSNYRLQAYFLYWVVFWIIFDVWSRHGRKFHGLREGSTVLVYANWMELLCVSLLPFTASSALNSNSDGVDADDVMPLHVNVLAVAVSNLVFQGIAHSSRETDTNAELTSLFIEEALAQTMVCVFVLVIGLARPALSFYFYVFLGAVSGLYSYRFGKLAKRMQVSDRLLDDENEADMDEDEEEATINSIFKTRSANFCDGVLAISSTLIVLEIKAPPPCKDLLTIEDCIVHWGDGCRPNLFTFECKYDDGEATKKRNLMILAYIVSFVIINLHWTLHHYLFDKVVLSASLQDFQSQFLNGHFCVFVAMLPFAFNLVTEYAIEPFTEEHLNPQKHHEVNPDENAARTALLFAGTVLTLSSLCLLGLLVFHRLRKMQWPSLLELLRFSLMPLGTAAATTAFVAGLERALFWWFLFLIPCFLLVVFIQERFKSFR